MKKYFKHFIALTLVLCMALSMGVTVFATSGGSSSSSGSGSSGGGFGVGSGGSGTSSGSSYSYSYLDPFEDVRSCDWFYDAVKWGLDKNIVGGTSATTFSPNNICTRAQIITFLWRAKGCPNTYNGRNNPFKDVFKADYYYNAVLWAYYSGIVNGTSSNRFSPNDKCTRAQTVTILWNLAGKQKVNTNCHFKDVNTKDYYYPALCWATKNGIINGTSPNTFEPNSGCTRAQIVAILQRYMG